MRNCEFYLASVDELPMDDSSMDFGYSIGVLHHVPRTLEGIEACVRKLKPGAPLLVYLYYAFDNRPLWFRAVWRISDFARKFISRMPKFLKNSLADLIALLVYLPLSRTSFFLEKRIGMDVSNFPLSQYRDKSLYTMRTDALDRFGTRLEKRFTKEEIKSLLIRAGLENIIFSNEPPYWCAVGTKRSISSS